MEINYEGLKKYLLALNGYDFGEELLEAATADELKRFGWVGNLYPEQVVEYGEYFLVDALGNDLTVVKLTRRKYKTPTGKLINYKIIKTIINDCRKIYGMPLNGYWIIPKRFIKK